MLHKLQNVLLLSALCGLFCYPIKVNANLVINEIMQSNVSGIMDDINDFPDSWIELYNNGEEAENLSNYHIGLKKKIDKAYKLPEKEVQPGEFVVIYCDKVESGLHTSFRLESNKKGEIYLFKDGKQIQLLEHPAFPAPDIAYGLDPETSEWGYEFTATPGAANVSGVCDADHLLGAPVFSVAGAILDSPVSLSLTLPEGAPEGCVIRYTLDGRNPSAESEIWVNGDELEISATTLVRAALFCEGWLTPLPTTHSYIFPDHDITLPIVSIVTDEKYFFDNEIGIYPNFNHEWRRPINIELFDHSQPESALNQVGECRISGGWSKNLPLKTLAIYANKRFGQKRLDYEFFPEMRPGVTNYKSVLLRNSGNDFYESYMRDAVVHETVGNNAQIDYQAVRSCVLFINGVYKGILNIRERSNDDNIFTNYNELEDIDMVENYDELKTGSMDSFIALKDFYNSPNHTYEEVVNLIDVKEVTDVHLFNMYYNNCDFPGNNCIFWRPQAEGGKWRMVMKDTDYAMGLKFGLAGAYDYDYPSISWFYDVNWPGGNGWGNSETCTRLFRFLLKYPEIRNEFIDRVFVYFGDFLNHRETIKNIDKRYNEIASEWPYHIALYDGVEGFPLEETTLEENVNFIKNWITQRDTFFPQHLADFYEVGKLGELNILQPEDSNVEFTMNELKLNTGEFHGPYPEGREFRITADANDDDILGWNIFIYMENSSDISKENKPRKMTMYSDTENSADESERTTNFAFTYPVGASKVEIQPVLNYFAGINDLTPDNGQTETIYDIQGRKVSNTENLTPGIYIKRQGSEVTKFIQR